MSALAIEELRFVQTEDGYVRTVQVTETFGAERRVVEVQIGMAVEVAEDGMIKARHFGEGTVISLVLEIAGLGKTVAEARALARALDRAADKVAVRQILAGA